MTHIIISVFHQKGFNTRMNGTSSNKAMIPIPRRMFICSTCHRVREVEYFVDPTTLFYTSICLDCRQTSVQHCFHQPNTTPIVKAENYTTNTLSVQDKKKKIIPQYMTIVPQAKWISKRRLSSKSNNTKYHLAKLLYHRTISK